MSAGGGAGGLVERPDSPRARRLRTLTWIALVVVAVAALVWALRPSGTRTDAERARDLAAEIRCPDCESLSALDSQTGSARAIRRDLRLRVDAGESDAEIRRTYADRYGDSILLKPAGDGLGLLVWGLPVVVLVVAAAGLVVAFRRWRSSPASPVTDEDAALVERARARRDAP